MPYRQVVEMQTRQIRRRGRNVLWHLDITKHQLLWINRMPERQRRRGGDEIRPNQFPATRSVKARKREVGEEVSTTATTLSPK